jgi:hypothetical protein
VQKTIDALLIIKPTTVYGWEEHARKRLWAISSYKRDYEKSAKKTMF